MAQFIPRSSFHIPSCVPKSYYPGLHAHSIEKIKAVLGNVALILECRDMRIPLSTQNPYLEKAIIGRQRIVVYTRADYCTDSAYTKDTLRQIHGHNNVFFWDKLKPGTTVKLLARLREIAQEQNSLTGLQTMVVGMPNVGKSSLVNQLREQGTPSLLMKGFRSKTGDVAGVTRHVGNSVRVILSAPEKRGVAYGVFCRDTPGVFQPYTEDGEIMIKLALINGIKKNLIPNMILADYLLYRLNQLDPAVYGHYSQPTNSIDELLTSLANQRGMLEEGGSPNLRLAAEKFLSLWREGALGRYVLEPLGEQDIREHQRKMAQPAVSLSQARKTDSEAHWSKKAENSFADK
ncbi:hypothetical protein E4U19_004164 [Claviceps sp. Clav32 group G5]|nr:hypothetical protein E4U40_002930 [Claviceps sp. LM458 group G5]KAG6035896.1 hypothetical protein E4U19_004164 [Claviceps sp. Clav32 group G5]KAG6048437.1 hypothetical protein E4U39_007433 [Claviceps sp. Clav50 group G5]